MTSTLSDLSEAVERYEQAVSRIENESVSSDQIWEVLNARGQVHAALERHNHQQRSVVYRLKALLAGKPQNFERELLRSIKQLDARLKSQSHIVQQVIKLSDWQEILPIFAEPPPWYDRYDWIWRGISLVCFGISLALLLGIFDRFSTGGLDFLNTLLILLSGGVTFLSGGASLTNTGQEGSERVFNSFGIPQRWWDELRCLLAIAACSVLILFWHYGLPWSAKYYISKADESNSIAVQESYYQRAIALDPDEYDAHFHLAKLYEADFSFDNAFRKYQDAKRIAAENSEKASKAEIGAIRVLLEDQKIEQADQRLRDKLEKADKMEQLHQITSDAEYELLKNLGLAYLETDDLTLTEEVRRLLKNRESENANVEPLQLEQFQSDIEAISNAIYWFNEGVSRTAQNFEKQYEMQTYLGWAYWKQKNFEESKRVFETTARLENKKGVSPKVLTTCLQGLTLAELLDQPEETSSKQFASVKPAEVQQVLEKCVSPAKPPEDEESNTVLPLQRLAAIKLEYLNPSEQ